MRAFSTANGGVMFIPDEIERKEVAVSYTDLAPGQAEKISFVSRLFGRGKKEEKPLKKAA